VNPLKRINALKKAAFSANGFDGHVILNSANLLYFLGFPGTSALLVPADGECTVYAYGVNYEQAKAEGKGFTVELVKGDEDLMAKIAWQAQNSKVHRPLVDSLGVESWRSLGKEFPADNVEVDSSFVQALRIVKDQKEIGFMRKAAELTSRGMEAAVEAVKPGVKEFEVAAEIEYAMRRQGAGSTAFETSVASGARSAFPHGGCTDRTIRDGDLVVVDIGSTCQSYCSDMTRTFVAGKPSHKQLRIFETVKRAQEKAFEAITAGAKAADVDGVARKVISDAGYGDYFVHGLGHGVGLEVHEAPTLNRFSKETLQAGMVVTDEPGVYLVGYGGVRIEDTVLVQKGGGEKLTVGPYSLTKE
jgi:Xaa-Pro aminopeptidase